MKHYSIVGIDHTKQQEFVAGLKGGEPAVLVREPSNPFDPLAVAVWVGGRRVGYVPKKQNSALAQFIDQTGGGLAITPDMAMDRTIQAAAPNVRAIEAKFVRSPNSSFPMVEVA